MPEIVEVQPVDDTPAAPGSAGPCPPCAAAVAGEVDGTVICEDEGKCWCALVHQHAAWPIPERGDG